MYPNLSDLKYFIVVAETGNLSRAAEKLGVTQPSLSVAMKRVESSLGVELLIRSKSGVYPTKAGDQFLKRSRQLLNSWETLKSTLNEEEETPSGQYSLGCHPSVGMYTLPFFMPELNDRFPKLDIRLSHDHSRKITEKVISFDLDIGIVVNPVKHPDLVINELCVDVVYFWKKKGMKPSADAMKTLICDPDLAQSQKMTGSLKKNEIVFEKYLHSNNLELVSRMTAAGLGVGVIPSRVAMMQDKGRIEKIDSWPTYKDKVCLVYRHEMRQTQAFKTLIDVIKSYEY